MFCVEVWHSLEYTTVDHENNTTDYKENGVGGGGFLFEWNYDKKNTGGGFFLHVLPYYSTGLAYWSVIINYFTPTVLFHLMSLLYYYALKRH